MIVDRLDNWRRYFCGNVGETVLSTIRNVTPDSNDTEMFSVVDNYVKARVMSYPTRTISEAVFESHRRFADVQVTISGEEGILWLPKDCLPIETPYNDREDVIYYKNEAKFVASVSNVPGQFVILFPGEIHSAGIHTPQFTGIVKKIIVKIEAQTLAMMLGGRTVRA